MINEFYQELYGQKQKFTIDETGLHISINSRQNSTEKHIPFENILINRTSQFTHNTTALLIAIVVFVISIILLISFFRNANVGVDAGPFWMLVSTVIFIYYYRSRSRKMYLSNSDGSYIIFIYEKKHQNHVDAFIDQLIKKRNEYLSVKYTTLNKHLSYTSQHDNLNWMLNIKVISKDQFDISLVELNKLFGGNQGHSPIGFKRQDD